MLSATPQPPNTLSGWLAEADTGEQAVAQGTQVSGKVCKVLSGSTNVNAKNWTLSHTNEVLDVTHTGSSGTFECISGLSKVEGSFEVDFDPNSPYYDSTRNIVPGRRFTLQCYIDANRFYSFTAQISEVTPTVEVAGVVTCSVSFSASGAITQPTG